MLVFLGIIAWGASVIFVDPRYFFKEIKFKILSLNSKNCGAIIVRASLGQDSIKTDDEKSTSDKLACFLSAVQNCQTAVLREEYSTWETYSSTTLFRTMKAKSGNCQIVYDEVSTDIGFYSNKQGACSSLKVFDPQSKESYGFLDTSSCTRN